MTLKRLVGMKRVKLLRERTGGVYYVPKSMVRRMEVGRKCYMEATIAKNQIRIKPVGTYGRKPVELVYVDARGNLRIPSSLVSRAKIGKGHEIIVAQEKANELTVL